MRKIINLAGKQIEDWFVIRQIKSRYNPPEIFWECRCVCGKIKGVSSRALRRDGLKAVDAGKMIEVRVKMDMCIYGRHGSLNIEQ